jgi:hypothetical protein
MKACVYFLEPDNFFLRNTILTDCNQKALTTEDSEVKTGKPGKIDFSLIKFSSVILRG